MIKPELKFLELFSHVVDSRWPSLATSLSLSSEDIADSKAKAKDSDQQDQALQMLKKWVSKDSATYGQLCQALKTIPLFQYV